VFCMTKRIMFPNLPNSQNLEILVIASMFEEYFSIDWICDLSKQKPSQVLSALENAVQQGWLIKKEVGFYAFNDLKERQKWQDSLSSREKQDLLKNIFKYLSFHLPYNEIKPQVFAPYLLQIENDLEGCHLLLRAGNAYSKEYDIDNSIKCYSKIIEDLSHLSGKEVDSLFIKTIINYAKISTARHKRGAVLSLLKEASARAQRSNQISSLALLKMHIAKHKWLSSQYSSSLKYFEEGWSIVEKVDDSNLLSSATTFGAFFLYWQGRFREAVRIYEKDISDVEKYPKKRFSLLATIMIGHCYALLGNVTQGLGMIDSIYKLTLERGDRYLAAYAELTIGAIMLDINRIDEAVKYCEASIETDVSNEWVQIIGDLLLSLAYYFSGEVNKSRDKLQNFFQKSGAAKISVRPYPYLLELCWLIEQHKLTNIVGISLEREVKQTLKTKNVFMKGVAYRYKALLRKRNGMKGNNVTQYLNKSMHFLKKSGHQVEIAKTQMELARQYLLVNQLKKAKSTILSAFKSLSPLNQSLVPDDLRSLIKKQFLDEYFSKEILKLTQQLVLIKDNKELLQYIISVGNRMTGAERGAIFLLDKSITPQRFFLRASKNITAKDIDNPSFDLSMQIIEEVATTGKGRISECSSTDKCRSGLSEVIRSRICVPMILRDNLVGVLYHDTRLLSSAFEKPDLDLLTHFAAIGAFALDNVTAYEKINKLNQRLRQEQTYYREEYCEDLHFDEIVGKSDVITEILAKISQVARTDTTVLITGETGTGKELVARAIHKHSQRSSKPFISVNCTSLPESLISTELFGHEKGAFTGAIKRHIGRFELADGGTLFLDEVGEIPLDVQVRLLQILQTKEFERVGGNQTLKTDFRLIAATNSNLEKAVEDGTFRTDLYYRINVFPIDVAPLRKRKEDIPLLAFYFLNFYGNKLRKQIKGIPTKEMNKLITYDWPGNVRELENIIERGLILSTGPDFIVPNMDLGSLEQLPQGGEVSLKECERLHILQALKKTEWKVRGPGGAAEILDIHPSTLEYKMKKLDIKRPRNIHKKRSAPH